MTEPTSAVVDTEAEKAAKLAAKEAAKTAKLEAAAAKKVEKDAAKVAKTEASTAAKAAKVQAKLDAKAAAVAAKEASKQPVKNDVRRPKPETVCGRCWAVYDQLSNERGSPAAIADAKAVLEAQGINEATIRTQYAHWRKFNEVSGRIESVNAPVAAEQPTT